MESVNWLALFLKSSDESTHTGKAVVMAIRKVIVKINRYSSVLLLQLCVQSWDILLWNLKSWPSIPLELCRLAQSTETCDEATGGALKLELSIWCWLDGDWETVGDEEKTTRGVGSFLCCAWHCEGCDGYCGKVKIRPDMSSWGSWLCLTLIYYSACAVVTSSWACQCLVG